MSVPFILSPTPRDTRPTLLNGDFLQAGPTFGWLMNCMYFRTFSPSGTALASSANGLVDEASVYMVFGVHCDSLACDAESKISAAIDAHLDLVCSCRRVIISYDGGVFQC